MTNIVYIVTSGHYGGAILGVFSTYRAAVRYISMHKEPEFLDAIEYSVFNTSYSWVVEHTFDSDCKLWYEDLNHRQEVENKYLGVHKRSDGYIVINSYELGTPHEERLEIAKSMLTRALSEGTVID